MTNMESGTHPVLDSVHILQDAVYLNGLGEALTARHIQDGRLQGKFTSWEAADSSYPVSMLYVFDEVTAVRSTFSFAPPLEVENPMHVVEFDDEDPSIRQYVPVLARILLESRIPLTIVDIGDDKVPVSNAMLHLTQDTSILSFAESIGLPAIYGPFDGNPYRKISNFLEKNSPLLDLLRFVEAA